jgi:hypothetical protein
MFMRHKQQPFQIANNHAFGIPPINRAVSYQIIRTSRKVWRNLPKGFELDEEGSYQLADIHWSFKANFEHGFRFFPGHFMWDAHHPM